MSDLISRTARLVPYAKRPKSIASFVTAYVYEPAVDEVGAQLGNLYVAVEVLVSGRASEEVVDLVIQTVGDKYYNDPSGEADPLARFEGAIRQTNHELSEYVGRGNAAWIGKLSAIIAVHAGKELHVAQTGSAEAFLYRGKAVSRISLSDTARPATPSKTFGSIATGELEANDRLLLATPALIHQIPLPKLQSVISNTSPNAAIAEISQLLEGAITNRIAAIVVEITTPELAAVKVRSDEPDEIELGNSENLAEAAIKAATPLAQTASKKSKQVARAALGSWQKLRPLPRRGSLKVVELIRQRLTTRKGRRISAVTVLALFGGIGLILWLSGSNAAGAKQFSQYQTLFQEYSHAQTLAADGNKTASRASLVAVQAKLPSVIANEAAINRRLKNNPLYEGEPTSVAAFKALVADQIDQLDGLVKVSPMTVAEISAKNARPIHFESDGAHAFVFDAANHNAISIINLETGDQKDSTANTSILGDVVNTTISSANDGIFILTNKPSVWFYRYSNDSLAEQTLAYGQWPKASSIASYGSNIYLLGDTAVYKNVRNANGYSPSSNYISTTVSSKNTSGLAVDGWIYVTSDSGLQRFLGPVLKQSLPTPSSLGHLTNLRSVAGGDFVIGTSQSSGRIAIWNAKADQVVFAKQITLQDTKKLYDAIYDQKLGKVFATVDNRLVSFSLKP